MSGRVRPRVRVYHQVRTAHLERAAQLPPAAILFGNKRYDFAEELARDLELVPAPGWQSTWWLVRHPAQVVEINEPLMLPAARSTALALLGLGFSRLLGRPRARVVSYAIENRDPTPRPAQAGIRRRLAHRLDLAIAHWIWRRLDRIAYGTQAAQDLYAARLPQAQRPEQTLVWALPAPVAGPVAKEVGQVLFLGAFTDRKGFSLLTRAWPLVRDAVPDATLQLIGKGRLQDLAEELANDDPRVRLLVDPPRQVIKDELARSQVLVLPSQPTSAWREQVGLPIVEGLSYGCTIVTTTETGLAGWLTEHQHRVLPADANEAQLAAAITDALRSPVADVRDPLPAQDGRLTADAWMFA